MTDEAVIDVHDSGDPWGIQSSPADPPSVENEGEAGPRSRTRLRRRRGSMKKKEEEVGRSPAMSPEAGPQPAIESQDPAETPTGSPATSTRTRTLMALGLALVLVVAATRFSNAQSVEGIAIEGAIGVRAEAALSAAAVSQNRAAQAVLVAQAVTLGLATEDDLDEVAASAETALVELERRVLQALPDLGDESPLVEAADRRLRSALGGAVGAASNLDLPGASAALDEAEPLFESLARRLTTARDDALDQIVIARETAGQVAVGSRILVAFLIPMLTVLGYRYIVVRAARRGELQRELVRERQMLQAKDQLIANISHELRTPLTGILGFSQEAALERDLSVEDLRMMAGVIAGEADELSRMVDDLITTARDKEDALGLAIEAVDPNAEMNAVRIPALIASRDIHIELPSVTVRADRLRLRQILRNLVSNALKYGGPNVSLEGVVKGDQYFMSVIDDGPGVSPEIEERLFARFVHKGDAPLQTGSVGLGLSIAHRLAEIMDGTLSYSRQDERTFFTLMLPVAGDNVTPIARVA